MGNRGSWWQQEVSNPLGIGPPQAPLIVFTEHGPFICLRGKDVHIDAAYDEVLRFDDPCSNAGMAFFQKGTVAVHDGDSFRRTAEPAPNLTLTFDDDGNVIDCDISPKPSILSWEVTTKPVAAPPAVEP